MTRKNNYVRVANTVTAFNCIDHTIQEKKPNNWKSRLIIFIIMFGLLGHEAFAFEPQYLPDIPRFYIATIAGTEEPGYNGDEIPADQAQLTQPRRIAFDSQGNLYIGDSGNSRVRYIDLDGIIHTFAGTGQWGYNGDEIPATSAKLNACRGVAVNPVDGCVYISEGLGNRIRKVDQFGIIHTYAGTGEQAASRYDPIYNGDEIPATEATISYPFGITFDLHGNLYIADTSNHRVRMVDTDGIIHTVAGTGVPGYNGDGIPATQAQINSPGGVAVDIAGNIYIADRDNHRVRQVTTDGIIHTFAGTGEPGYNGDGISATDARLFKPIDVAINKTGILLIADTTNNRIRAVGLSGIIYTLAGTGQQEYNGDNIPAKSANLYIPRGVAFDADNNVYIADKFNNRVRFVKTSRR